MFKGDKKQKKQTSGITLVALVVTIVVLLILAGITITMLFSDSGIINKAREAAEATKNAQSDTEQGLENLAGDIEDALFEPKTITENDKGKLVDIKDKYANYTDKTSKETVPVPGGYCIVKDSSTEQNTIKSGLVISDLADDTLDNNKIGDKTGNQFVWVPVPDVNEIYEVQNGKNVGKLYNFTSTSSSAKAYSPTSFREPDVVTGSNGSSYDESTTYLNIITNLTTKTADGFKALLQKEFDSMIESVKRYGGFYIGRYETGNLSSNDNGATPVVQKGATVGGANWYYQYQEIKNIAKENKNVTSSMIWGCQWDRTLEWIATTNNEGYSLLTNSSSWGNYKNYSEVTNDNSTASGGSDPQKSGTNSNWQKNHIYDLAGNAFDWTLEANDAGFRVYRGGYYGFSGSSYPASDRNNNHPYVSFSSSGSRSTLYINL